MYFNADGVHIRKITIGVTSVFTWVGITNRLDLFFFKDDKVHIGKISTGATYLFNWESTTNMADVFQWRYRSHQKDQWVSI